MRRFDTSSDAEAAFLKTGTFVRVKSTGAVYQVKTLADYGSTPDGYVDRSCANTNVLVLQYSGALNLAWAGAVGDGVTNNTSAIYAVNTHTTDVYVPPGTFLTDMLTLADGANWHGDGHNSVLKLNDGYNNNLITLTSVSNVKIQNLKLDQNRANQTAGHVIRIASSSNITLTDLDLVNGYNYGIGAQDGTLEDIIIDNVSISTTGSDGIDFKNKDDDNQNIVISNVTVKNFGIGASNKAGIDLRGAARLSNIHVSISTDTSHDGIRFRDGELLDVNGLGAHKSSLSNFEIVGTGLTGAIGVAVNARDVKISNGDISGVSYGLRTTDLRTRILNVTIEGALVTGFDVSGADSCKLVNCVADSCERGYNTDAHATHFVNCDVLDCTLHGIRLDAGVTAASIFGGSVSGCTPNIGDAGSDTVIMGVDGYVTESSIQSATIPIDATGIQSFSITHGLVSTPDAKDVQLTIVRNTAVDDWEIGFLRVNSTSSSQVTCALNVVTASATGGATVYVNVRTRMKAG